MTLKTLKPKANNLLILDDEFLEYCRLNKIEDIEKLARETFKKGFDLLKYGDIPTIDIQLQTKVVKSEVRQIETKITQEMGTPENVTPKNIVKKAEKELIKELKSSKTDLYGE